MMPRLICLSLLLAAVGLAAGCNRAFKATANPTRIASNQYKRVFAAAVHVLRDKGFTVDRQDYRFGRITSRPLNSPTLFEPWRPLNTTGRQAVQSTLDDLRRTVRVFLNPVKPSTSTSTDQASPPARSPSHSTSVSNAATPHAAAPGAPESRRNSAAPRDEPAPRQPQSVAASRDAAQAHPPARYQLRVEVLLEDHQLPTRRLVDAARGDLSKLSAVPTEWRRRGITAGYWLPLGRDPYLEARLVRDILTRARRSRGDD